MLFKRTCLFWARKGFRVQELMNEICRASYRGNGRENRAGKCPFIEKTMTSLGVRKESSVHPYLMKQE